MPQLPIRGFQIHLTHYDHDWWRNKDQEIPFDLSIGLEIVSAMANAGFNLLMIDCADAVEYASHPELRRHYTQPMRVLAELAACAHEYDMDTVPTLNFGQSGYYHSNDWFRPHNQNMDREQYWQPAFELIDEPIEAAKPERYFNIGMEEDHWRSAKQFGAAVKTLRDGLHQRGLRALMWNMSAQHLRNAGLPLAVVAERALAAEPHLPRDVVQMFVDWSRNPGKSIDVDGVRRITSQGFELWGNPGPEIDQNQQMVRALQENGGSGILFTRWIPCIRQNRQELLTYVREAGALCKSESAASN